MGLMTKKKIAAAMETNAVRALKKAPYVNVLALIVNVNCEKSGSPKIAAIKGGRRVRSSSGSYVCSLDRG